MFAGQPLRRGGGGQTQQLRDERCGQLQVVRVGERRKVGEEE